jgi:hypothetical protein
VEFSFDEDSIKGMINEAEQAKADQVEAVFDKVRLAAQGKSLDEVKAHLQREVRLIPGGDITDPELTSYAEALARGQRIDVKPKQCGSDRPALRALVHGAVMPSHAARHTDCLGGAGACPAGSARLLTLGR